MSDNERLLHLWKKKERTAESMRNLVQEYNTWKKQRQNEVAETQKYIQDIKSLTEDKDSHIAQLEADNRNLLAELKQIKRERQAYLKEHEAIAGLMQTEGLTDVTHTNFVKSVEHLLQQRGEMTVKLQALESSITALSAENEDVCQQSQRYSAQIKKLSEEAALSAQKQEQLQSRIQKLQENYTRAQDTITQRDEQLKNANTRTERLWKELASERQKQADDTTAKPSGKPLILTQRSIYIY